MLTGSKHLPLPLPPTNAPLADLRQTGKIQKAFEQTFICIILKLGPFFQYIDVPEGLQLILTFFSNLGCFEGDGSIDLQSHSNFVTAFTEKCAEIKLCI
jgi:hypothetical protein